MASFIPMQRTAVSYPGEGGGYSPQVFPLKKKSNFLEEMAAQNQAQQDASQASQNMTPISGPQSSPAQANPAALPLSIMAGQSVANQLAPSTAGASSTSSWGIPSLSEVGEYFYVPGAPPTAGATIIPAGLPVPEGMTAVGSAIDGGTMVAPESAASFGPVGQVLGPVAAIHGGYNLFNDWTDTTIKPGESFVHGAETGAGIGATVGGPVGAGIGAVIGGPVGVIGDIGGKLFGGKKSKAQKKRDQIRGGLKEAGFLDDQNRIKLPDGSYFDMGKDGNARLSNGLRYYELDWKNPLVGKVVGLVNPLSAIVTGGDDALMADITAYLTNAAMSNASDYTSVRNNVLQFYHSMNVVPSQTAAELQTLLNEGAITEEEFKAMVAANNTLVRGAKPQFTNEQAATPIPGLSGTPVGQEQAASAESPTPTAGKVFVSPTAPKGMGSPLGAKNPRAGRSWILNPEAFVASQGKPAPTSLPGRGSPVIKPVSQGTASVPIRAKPATEPATKKIGAPLGSGRGFRKDSMGG